MRRLVRRSGGWRGGWAPRGGGGGAPGWGGWRGGGGIEWRAVGVLAGVVVAAEVVVELAGLEHVPGGGENRVADGDDGLGVSAAPAEALVVGGEVGVLGSGGRERGFGERGTQPFRALAGASG